MIHDDVMKWKHFPRYWPFVRGIHRSPVNSPHKGQWRGALMFSLICARINGWVNTREAGDLRRYRAHYDVIVMSHTNVLPITMAVLTYWGRDKIATISQTTFSKEFFNQNVQISINISMRFVPKGPINNIPALVQMMVWRRLGEKPLSEPMVTLLTYICVAWPQWVKRLKAVIRGNCPDTWGRHCYEPMSQKAGEKFMLQNWVVCFYSLWIGTSFTNMD